MAAALQANGEGRVISIDPDEKWAQSTQASLPDDLAALVEVSYSPGVDCLVGGKPSKRFRDHPRFGNDALPDMIYIDGAPPGAAYAGAENVACIEAETPLRPGTMIFIDSRAFARNYFVASERRGRYDTVCYAVDCHDIRSNSVMQDGLGFDQFSNTIVKVV
jgi:predicted O-methyltransferase YrrM